MDAITIDALQKSYGNQPLFDALDMRIEAGEIYGLLGPNGAGKSTLMGIILGLNSFQGGSVRLFGLEVGEAKKTLSQKINALPEFFSLYGWMNALEYLRFFAELYARNPEHSALEKLLDDVGLDRRDRRPVGTYSQGMQKRLGLARALINDPELLILDEPTNGLDPKGRREIHDLLIELNRRRHTTILLSTHILDDVQRLCSRVGILHQGRLRYEDDLNRTVPFSRYRFELADPTIDPLKCNSAHLRFVRKTGRWIECDIENAAPYKAIEEMHSNGIRFNQAVALSGSLEHLYFTYTKEAAS